MVWWIEIVSIGGRDITNILILHDFVYNCLFPKLHWRWRICDQLAIAGYLVLSCETVYFLVFWGNVQWRHTLWSPSCWFAVVYFRAAIVVLSSFINTGGHLQMGRSRSRSASRSHRHKIKHRKRRHSRSPVASGSQPRRTESRESKRCVVTHGHTASTISRISSDRTVE